MFGQAPRALRTGAKAPSHGTAPTNIKRLAANNESFFPWGVCKGTCLRLLVTQNQCDVALVAGLSKRPQRMLIRDRIRQTGRNAEPKQGTTADDLFRMPTGF